MATAAPWLIAAGWLSVAASVLHLVCIAGGASWYRALGAGEGMARQVERGARAPTLITLGIAGVLGVWALYAFAAAGLLPRLSLTRTILVAISAVLLLRGLAVPAMRAWRPDLSRGFIIWSALIVTGYGLVFANATRLAWPSLGKDF